MDELKLLLSMVEISFVYGFLLNHFGCGSSLLPTHITSKRFYLFDLVLRSLLLVHWDRSFTGKIPIYIITIQDV